MLHGVWINSPFPHFTVLIASNFFEIFLLFLEEISISRLLHDNLDSSTSISKRLIDSVLELLDLRMLFIFTVYRRLMDQ